MTFSETETEPDYRFTLANERTLLSWNRTSLAVMAAGVAVTHVLPSGGPTVGHRIAGVLLVAVGGLLAVGAYRHWIDVDRAIRRSEPLPGSPLPAALVVVVVVTSVLAAVLVAAAPQ